MGRVLSLGSWMRSMVAGGIEEDNDKLEVYEHFLMDVFFDFRWYEFCKVYEYFLINCIGFSLFFV
jgi:hypothetical protein